MLPRRILIVDDEPHIVEFLAMNLRQNGYDYCFAYDGECAIKKAISDKPDLILLDSMLPGISGVETCRILKQTEKTTRIPIIFLSAKSEESDKVLGLAIGADDYITKPFSIKELFARIEAVLRRSNRDAFPGSSNRRYFQDVEIDIDSHIVEKSGERIQLSPVEFSILSMLCDAKGKVVPRSLLIEKLLLSSGDAEARSLDVHIRNLRKKLGFSPNPYGYIETVRGIGLKINE